METALLQCERRDNRCSTVSLKLPNPFFSMHKAEALSASMPSGELLALVNLSPPSSASPFPLATFEFTARCC